MKLILSSKDFRGEQSRKVILSELGKPLEECRVLFVPNEKATKESIGSGKYLKRMEEIGFARENVHVLDCWNPVESCGLDIDLIYVSGGNTFLTLQRLRECGFDSEIVRYVQTGVTYVGGSAGAHIVTQDVGHLREIDPIPEGMTDFRGLGLYEGVLICHYTEERRALRERLMKETRFPVRVLTDEDSLVIEE